MRGNRMKTCRIVGAGDFCTTSLNRNEDSFFIAADKGFKNLTDCGILPDLLVGDFDSLGFVPEFPNILKYPVEKDKTDMQLAVEYALEKDFDLILMYGALGGRLDHSLSNLLLLNYISKQGKKGFIISEDFVVSAITDGELIFSDKAQGVISVFALGEKAEHVTLRGLKYTLDDALLTADSPLGVSNEFLGQKASVSVKNGTLTVLWFGSLDNCLSL